MNIKRIMGAKTSQKIATLLSVGAIFTPLVGCSAEKNHEEEHEKLEIVFCDTSDISAQNYYDGYVESYSDGYTTYIIDQMEEIKKSYNKLRTIAGTYDADSDGITFSFDGTVMPYESKYAYVFYANDEVIKKVIGNNVWVKTRDGYIEIENKLGSYIIINCNEKQNCKTKITYRDDKSCLIEENDENRKKTYEFDENGNLVHSEIRNGNSFEEKIYVDGNLNEYTLKNEKYEKEVKKDGSYIITEREYHAEKEWLGYDFNFSQYNCNIKYYYGNDDKLDHVDAQYENGRSYKAIAYPNGHVFSLEEVHDENGNLVYCKKIESVYNIQKNTRESETEFLKLIGADGNEHTELIKYDYTLISPDNLLKGHNYNGDVIYLCKDGVKQRELKEGFIYEYRDGQFVEAYKVEGKNVKYADEDGNIIRILNDKEDIGYVDYENNIKSYEKNLGEDVINIDFNGENYILEEDGSVYSYDNNSVIIYNKNKDTKLCKYLDLGYSELRTPDETIRYDVDDKITSITRDNYYVSYYDYDKNIIHKINENGIYKEFFDDGLSVKLIKNLDCEEPFEYGEYVLKQGSTLEFNENKSLKKYYYDDTKYIENNKNGDSLEIKENGTLYKYNWVDNKLQYTIQNVDDPDNAVKTEYYDYENNSISIISNNQSKTQYFYSEDGSEQKIYKIINVSDDLLNVYDAEGSEFVLEKDDYVEYWRNGNAHCVKQGPVTYEYFSRESKEYYWAKTEETWVLYHDDRIIYEAPKDNIFVSYSGNQDGSIRKVISVNGDIIEEEQAER